MKRAVSSSIRIVLSRFNEMCVDDIGAQHRDSPPHIFNMAMEIFGNQYVLCDFGNIPMVDSWKKQARQLIILTKTKQKQERNLHFIQ